MKTSEIAKFANWWFKVLNFEDSSAEDIETLDKIFGPFSINGTSKDDWRNFQLLVEKIWWTKQTQHNKHAELIFGMFSANLCKQDDCPVKEKLSQTYPKRIPKLPPINLIVGPRGHLAEGDPNEFIERILELLATKGEIKEAYYHDPFAVKSINQNPGLIEDLQKKISNITIVTGESGSLLNSNITVKKIPSGEIHDRFIVTYDEDERWKGVLIGSSINAFPIKGHSNTHTKKHFIIASLEEKDASKLAEIVRAYP